MKSTPVDLLRRVAGPRMQACPRPADSPPRFRMPLWRSFTAVRAKASPSK
jgi:hypothetical protein